MRLRSVVADLVVADRCAGCAVPGGAWCRSCAGSLGALVPVGGGGLPPAYAVGHYRGAARRAVLAYKERGRRALAAPLGVALSRALLALSRAGPVAGVPPGGAAPGQGCPAPRPFVLVPAPSRPAAARRRGGQHMVPVAEACAAALRAAGITATVARALRVHRRARDSVGLDAAARAANLAGRVRAVPRRSPPPGSHVVLLDDVITTGATATACVAALGRVGVSVTAVLALTTAE
ncbi:ComF family protein [Actinophytocola xanthii]|uniref:Phosphoribosyltransferase domain-containing protein n=1 Tax=Actinophytocola xanthii TaxID=1912961 RepID=A0A1Q8CXM6_9PSEU|nr:ComF family protein [Actinophytocola xanthii]OLF19093.1 hypothetical protein BU204_03010 [Actinophytocola xanthii]